ncbi:hypothetical protein PILCRDRAFT_24281, partial [Piloderma croceum F 1598]
IEVTYIMSIMSAAEARKTVVSKRIAKSAILKLNMDEPWETIQAQLLVKIDHALSPSQIRYDQYDIKFYITRVLPKPGLSLSCKTDYDLMILKARKLKDCTVNITVVQLASDDDKENDREAELVEVAKPKKKAVRTRRDPATLPGNVNKNRFIQELRDEYKCKKPDSACPGTYCFDSPDGNHIVLSHAHIDCWASAMLKDDDSATLLKPPNHKLFDPTNSISPVIQRRQALLAAQNPTAVAPAPPVINFNGAFDFLRPLIPHAPAEHVNPTPSIQFSVTLLPSTRLAGPDMTLEIFCTTYGLSPKIIEKFTANDYLHARFLRFILITELTDMGFTRGEIAALRDA